MRQSLVLPTSNHEGGVAAARHHGEGKVQRELQVHCLQTPPRGCSAAPGIQVTTRFPKVAHDPDGAWLFLSHDEPLDR